VEEEVGIGGQPMPEMEAGQGRAACQMERNAPLAGLEEE
jgi:hypothetical protein